ncbi:MAG: alpha/beta fold hydrolase [Myxococcales bacterium]|nr:alpha/beta fold hydrolase [Myxococcales bacterium]
MKLPEIPQSLRRRWQRFNRKLLPPQEFQDSLALLLSALEEAFFVGKNFLDGGIHVSQQMLYGQDYRRERLARYQGQSRLLVMVPGYMETPRQFYRLERLLGLDIFDAFTWVFSDFPYSQDLTLSAEQLCDHLRDLLGEIRPREVYLLGHSQGGMIIRAAVQHGLAGGLPVKKCLFLSSPHQGTWAGLAALPHRGVRQAAALLPYIRKVQGESGMQLIPGSRFLRELNARPLDPGIEWTSVYYSLDPMIWPPNNAILPYPEARNHYIHKIGHAQPLYCSRAAQVAVRALYGESAAWKRP